MQRTQAHAQIEAVLFALGEAVPLARLVRLDESDQLRTAPEYAAAIRAILEERRLGRLLRAALEVLSIVAYYQPVTKTHILPELPVIEPGTQDKQEKGSEQT